MSRTQNGRQADLELQNVREICLLESKALERRSFGEQIGEEVCSNLGRISSVSAHILFFAGWIAWNGGVLPGARPFDPFPFPLLTLLAAMEAVLLTLLILIGQNRAAERMRKRRHLDLQITLLAELEATKTLQMLHDLCEIHGLPIASDPEVELLSRHTDPGKLVEEIRRSMQKAEPGI
jgi:uncharacterized membrane protein